MMDQMYGNIESRRISLNEISAELTILIERLDNIRRYAMVNTIAVMKISKKYDKHVKFGSLLLPGAYFIAILCSIARPNQPHYKANLHQNTFKLTRHFQNSVYSVLWRANDGSSCNT
jgi:SPX domain protein involved in polyphosphate accumulation